MGKDYFRCTTLLDNLNSIIRQMNIKKTNVYINTEIMLSYLRTI